MQILKNFWQRERFWLALALLIPPLLTLVLYGRVLWFPFFLDDILNFNFMAGRSLFILWTDASSYLYYRPLVFTLWRVLQLLFGETNTVAFHVVDLGAWILIGWLTSYLTTHLTRQPVAGVLASILIVTYPFAPQVVANVGHAFHLITPLLFFSGLAALTRYRQTRRLTWAGLAFVVGMIAPAAHETLIMIGALMMVWIILDRETFNLKSILEERHSLRLALSVLICNALWLLWWQSIPKSSGQRFYWVGWESLYKSLAYFAQGISYPFAYISPWLMTWGFSDANAALGLGVLGLLVLSTVLIWRRYGRLLLLGLATYGLIVMPVIFGLAFDYVIGNLRFLTPPSPAVVILWATALVSFIPASWSTRLRASIISLTLAVIVIPSMSFVQRMIDLHALSLQAARQVGQVAKTEPTLKHLVINPTDWISLNPQQFALGHESVMITPSYLTLDGLAYVNSGRRVQIDAVQFSNIRHESQKYWYNIAAADENWNTLAERLPNYDRVWLTRYSDERIDMVEAGRVEANAPPTFATPLASFDAKVLLVSANGTVVGKDVRLELVWQVLQPIQGEAFRHVADCEGHALGLGDGPALGGVYPVWLWRAQDRLTDVRYIPLEKLSSCYQFEIGLYNPQNGQRYLALDVNQKRFENDVVIIEKR